MVQNGESTEEEDVTSPGRGKSESEMDQGLGVSDEIEVNIAKQEAGSRVKVRHRPAVVR